MCVCVRDCIFLLFGCDLYYINSECIRGASVCVSVCVRECACVYNTYLHYIDAFHPYFRAFKIYLVIFSSSSSRCVVFCSLTFHFNPFVVKWFIFPILRFSKVLPHPHRTKNLWHLLNFPTHHFIEFQNKKWFIYFCTRSMVCCLMDGNIVMLSFVSLTFGFHLGKNKNSRWNQH